MTRRRNPPSLREHLIFHEDGTTSLKPDAPKEIVEIYNEIHSYDDREPA